MSGYRQMFWFVIFPFLVLMAIGVGLQALGYGSTAPIITVLGSVTVVMVVLSWVVVFDSRRRWPGLPVGIRLYRVITLRRG